MISTEKKDDILPLCPHCKTELSTLWYRELMKDLGKRCIYFCPHCRKVLGITHRKGFWMG